MIKNIIFDIGNVLAHFRWEEVFHEDLKLYGEDFERVADATCRNPVWVEFDRGVMSDEEITKVCVGAAPEYEETIRRFFNVYPGDIIRDYDYSYAWLQSLKAAGYKVYILSNYGKTAFNACQQKGHLKFLELADGRVVSYDVKMIKPDIEIYRTLLTRFDLDPHECLFIDDRPENVAGAERAGIKGIVFTDYKKAAAELDKMLNFAG